jgi:hypothetical protein
MPAMPLGHDCGENGGHAWSLNILFCPLPTAQRRRVRCWCFGIALAAGKNKNAVAPDSGQQRLVGFLQRLHCAASIRGFIWLFHRTPPGASTALCLRFRRSVCLAA